MQLTDIRIKLCDTHGSLQGNLHGNAQGNVHGGLQAHADLHGASRGNRPAMGGPENNSPAQGNRLKAFCALTFDRAFVIRDVKLIDGNDGLFVAMPSRKICDRCARCGDKNHLRARYCNNCGARLDENRVFRTTSAGRPGFSAAGGFGRVKLHADIAHPIHADCRHEIEQTVITAYWQEVEKSKLPGYVPPNIDGEDVEFLEPRLDSRARLSQIGSDGPVHSLPAAEGDTSIRAVSMQ